jgi:hypothetical protein
MNKNGFLVFTLTFATLVAFLHLLAIQYYLYWLIWWYDIIMHFLGGVVVASFTGWFTFDLVKRLGQYKYFILVLGIFLVVAVLWEIFEYSVGFTYRAFGSYKFDTTKDIIVGLIGASTFLAFSLELLPRRRVAISETKENAAEQI